MNKNLEQRIKILRERYKEFGEKYGKKVFNLEKFEQRYENALQNRFNLEIFVTAEEEALTELYNEILNPKTKEDKYQNSFMKKVDDIIEEYDSRMKIYTYINFHPEANEELKYLFGAIKQFYLYIFPLLESIFGSKELGSNVMKDFSVFYGFIDYYARDTQNGFSRRIEDHIIKIKHYSTKEVNQDYRNIMIESAQYFNKLYIFIQKHLDKIYFDKEMQTDIKFFGKEKLSFKEILNFTLNWID